MQINKNGNFKMNGKTPKNSKFKASDSNLINDII